MFTSGYGSAITGIGEARFAPAAAGDGFATLEVVRRGPVGWLVFDRPERRNAIDATMSAELERAWHQLEQDDDVAVIVNTGNGSAFQSGVDLAALATDRDGLRRFSRQTRDAQLRLTGWHNGVTKPVIAAVNGVCAGGGLHFVADADLVIASTAASFVDAHTSVGQVSAYETIGLLRKSSAEVTLRMAFVGRAGVVGPQRALQLGLVGEVVPAGELRARAQTLGELIADRDRGTLRARKHALWQALEHRWAAPA
jgi:enoyl-CoA hydratase/carnithine racemase